MPVVAHRQTAAGRRLGALGSHLAAAEPGEAAQQQAKVPPLPEKKRPTTGALSFDPALGEPFKYPGEEETGLSHPEAHRRSLALLGAATPPEQEAWRGAAMLGLADEQLQFFDTFGYLRLPGLLADRAAETATAFEQVWAAYGGGQNGQAHDGNQRSCIVPFLDSHPDLCSLLDDPRIHGLAVGLLGPDFNLMGSDGNYYAGDTE